MPSRAAGESGHNLTGWLRAAHVRGRLVKQAGSSGSAHKQTGKLPSVLETAVTRMAGAGGDPGQSWWQWERWCVLGPLGDPSKS